MSYNLNMSNYTVSLRISSRILDTSEITKELGLTPTQTRAAGERRSAHTVWDEAMWEFEVFPKGRQDWDLLESGLAALLKTFIPHSKALHEYRKKYGVLIWCGQFSAGFGGGPTLSAEILKSLGDFGVPLELSVYFSAQQS
ncbi:MAG TPA: DUF4279 domain-containing protein [Candidatus Angelobacter sp.]